MLLLLYLAQLRSSPLACNKYLHMSHAASASGMIAVALEAQALHSQPAVVEGGGGPRAVDWKPGNVQALMHHECTTVLRSPLRAYTVRHKPMQANLWLPTPTMDKHMMLWAWQSWQPEPATCRASAEAPSLLKPHLLWSHMTPSPADSVSFSR